MGKKEKGREISKGRIRARQPTETKPCASTRWSRAIARRSRERPAASEEATCDREGCEGVRNTRWGLIGERDKDAHLSGNLEARGRKDAATPAILVAPRRASCTSSLSR